MESHIGACHLTFLFKDMLLLEFLYTSEMSFEMDYKREKNMLKNNLSFRRILIIYLLKDNRPFE